MESYQAGIATPSRHLLFHKQFEHLLPASHPNVDSMLANPGAFKLPASHPNLDLYVSYRARFRPGHLLCIYLLLIILISSFMKLAITSLCRKTSAIEGLSLSEKDMLKLSGSGTTSNLSIAEELCMSPTPLARKELYASNGTIAQRDSIQSGVRGSVLQSSLGSSEKMVRFQDQESVIIVEKENNTKVKLNTVPPHLDMIYFKARLDEKRGQKKLYAYGASLVSLPPNELLQRKNRLKDASLITKIWYSQIPFTNISIVNIIFTILYVFLNAVALLYPNGPVDLQTGIASLSIANLIILTIPTTSWMTWLGLGNNSGSLHKYIGIWTVILALTHVSYYIPTLAFHMKEHVYWTGMGCTSALLILAITSTNYIRKNNFKVFWYGHYASLSGSLLAFMHVQETRPFVVMGFFMMVLEFGWKFWKKMPQKTMSFESKGENTVQVRLVDQGAARKPGQYYYVNFPEVSLTGWYSFWVSSGEREDGVELCIRAQNEYTSDIVKHCKLVEITGKLPWARVSGPFGGADLKIRKYPVLVLVGGGEGITPVVSILKDIYHVGKYNPALGAVTPHSMEAVYLVWVMPTVDDATVYIKEIKKSINNSSLSKFPPLVVWIYITRPKQIIEEPLMAGKPNFDRIFDAVESNHPGRSTMIFASGPLEMISEVYSEGLRREKGGCRVDFEYVSC